jgi:4-amino-4-deoxy-L-arabinose transferase-like glycosyltransferase
MIPRRLQGCHWDYPLLVLVCLVLFLPGQWALPPFDRDEARFAQASRQMLESGDYLDIRFQDQPRYQKPVGIYWLQALSAWLSGAPNAIGAYRIPSLLGAVAAVLLTFSIGALLFDRPTGRLAALLLASTLLLNVEARMAKTDALLLACILTVQRTTALAWLHRTRVWQPTAGQWLAGWLALAAGILIKGPVAPAVAGVTLLAAGWAAKSLRWLRPLRPGWGLALVLMLVVPWLAAILWHSQGRFLADSLGQDFVAKLFGGQESHGAPPGFYLASFWIGLWPVWFLVALALPWAWRERRRPQVLFLLAWILPVWVLCELVPTKLLHYLLPIYPALTLVAARAWRERGPVPPRYARAVGGLWLVGGALLPLGLAGAYYFLQGVQPFAPGPALAAWLALAGGVAGWRHRTRAGGPLLPLLSAVILYAQVFQQALPAMDRFWLSRTVVRALPPPGAACPRYRLLAVGFTEPSLVFLAGTDSILVPYGGERARERVRAFLAAEPCGLALLPEVLARDLHPAGGLGVNRVATVAGFDYTKGRFRELLLISKACRPSPGTSG